MSPSALFSVLFAGVAVGLAIWYMPEKEAAAPPPQGGCPMGFGKPATPGECEARFEELPVYTPPPEADPPALPDFAALDTAGVDAWVASLPPKDLWTKCHTMAAAVAGLPPDASPGVRVGVLQAATDAFVDCHRSPQAVASQTAALEALRSQGALDGTTAVSAFASLARALQSDAQHEAALEAVTTAMAVGEVPPAAAAVLLRMEASIHGCLGDSITALQRFEDALRVDGNTPDEDRPVPSLAHHVDLLQRVRLNRPPKHVDAALASRIAKLVAAGPWPKGGGAAQLPPHYVPGLTAQPWHTLGNFPELQPLVQVLQDAAHDLRDEYKRLASEGRLEGDKECVAAGGGGRWFRYPINGVWHRRNADGCSLYTPAACRVMEDVRSNGLATVIRAGYSVVEPGAFIQPHYGISNAQIKLHLGIDIPQGADGQPCAKMNVGGSVKAWLPGSVLIFDDSFLHSVFNNCTATRAVFQVVITHPDLAAGHEARDATWLAHGH